MPTFDDFTKALGSGAKDLATDSFADFQSDANADATAFIGKIKDDLERWTGLLSSKAISEQDFSDLVHAKKALIEIHRLSRTGVTLARLERFRTALINLVVHTAFDVFL